MSDVFSRLVDRALDRAPRARPQISPRFARRPAALPLEAPDREVESFDELEVGPSVPRSAPASFEDQSPREAPRDPRPVHGPRPPGRNAPAVSAPDRVIAVEREVHAPAPASGSTAEHTVERVERSVVEHTRFVDARPLAAPPVPLRPADAAALRPVEPRAAAPSSPDRGTAAGAHSVVRETTETAPPEAIHVSIGRIDVRATPAASPVAAPARSRPAPMGLDEYLRRRNEGR
jgi:hypothetical protein